MPRLLPSMDSAKYRNLRAILQWDRERAKETILQLKEDSKQVVADIEEEMVRLYGYKWKIWIGFHAIPSMDHLHMHIISSDLCSPSLKNKKHYNSFHPKLGFFLHLDDVLEWFEGDESYYQTMSRLPVSQYEPLLKENLACWRCNASQKNLPALKAHLEEEWKREKEKALLHKKRKREEAPKDEEPAHTSSRGEQQQREADDDSENVRQKKRLDDSPALAEQDVN